MNQIRVLLAEMPQMLRDAFTQLVAGQPDMRLVGNLADPLGLLLAAGQTRTDAIIMGLRDSEFPGICSHLLGEYPHIKVVGITRDGRRAFLYELRPQRAALGEVSPQDVLDAIRGAVHSHSI